ncbi:MAG: transcription termination factor NusA [Pseudomonadota bacterium]
MNKEILLVVDSVSNEKGVEKEIIFEAIEAALASATRKKRGNDIDVRVKIDRTTGDYETFRRWHVISDEDPEFESTQRQILESYARRDYPDIKIDDYIEQPIDSVSFGRIAAQSAKQVMVQKVREAERKKIVSAYEHRIGELVTGIVKRSERSGVYIDLGGNAEGFIPREEMISRETVRPGDRLRAYLKEVRAEGRGPQLYLSRTVREFLIELFKIEVPEVGQGLIEIMGAARDPGLRAKISVKSNDPRVDPVGACVGMRGARVQSVSNEMAGERIDIITWDENPAQYVINAMSPADVLSIVIDEDRHAMDIAVDDERLSQAIGHRGQNVQLASQLTQWELNVMSLSEAEEKSEAETSQLQEMFMAQLDVDEEVAVILVQEGFASVEEVAYVPPKELMEIDEFDEDIVEELRRRARDALLTLAIAAEETLGEAKPAEDLLEMEGMDKALAYDLASAGVLSMEDLAEQSVDDLLEIKGMDEQRAAELIMIARAPWFEEEAKGE